MSMETTTISAVAPYAFGALALALVLALVRIIRGPTLPDRVVALDLIASIAIGFIAMHILSSGQPAFLSIAAILALIVFLATLAFARYLERRGHDD